MRRLVGIGVEFYDRKPTVRQRADYMQTCEAVRELVPLLERLGCYVPQSISP